MGKVIFELEDVRLTPKSEPKLNIQISMEPARQNGLAKELADKIMDFIEEYTQQKSGDLKITDVNKY